LVLAKPVYWPELLVLDELVPPLPMPPVPVFLLLLDVVLLVVPPVAAPPGALPVPPVAAPLPAAKARLLDAANAAASINVLIFMSVPLRPIDGVPARCRRGVPANMRAPRSALYFNRIA
jgi:hypothetical protein